MTLSNRDKNIIWHPFTQEKTAELPIPIKKGEGSYLYDEDGKKYLDLISSWWVNLHGHGKKEIADAIYNQALSLEHVIFAGFTHDPAVELCELLKQILPKSLERFFFSDNGSTSVEVALKMAHQYWYNKGEKQRKIFLSFEGGYHGDTLGAMSVGKGSGYHDAFDPLMFEVINLPYPQTWENDNGCKYKEDIALEIIQKQLEKNSKKISAIILEPLIQGASGMRACRVEFLQKVIDLVREYGILVIFDEVMTGFGRTGTYFASQQIERDPDFICISKGITGGFLPLALTVTTNKTYDAFLSDNWDKAFAHGHSYTANPIACAAAIASFKLLTSKEVQDSIKMINNIHKDQMDKLSSKYSRKIKNVRVVGTIAAFEVNRSENLNAYFKKAFFEKGLLIRPLENIVYLLPPYSISSDELKHSYKEIASVLESI